MSDHDIAQVPSTANPRRMVWAVRCVICRRWIRLGTPTREATERILGTEPAVHADCKDKPSVKTPTLEGLDL